MDLVTPHLTTSIAEVAEDGSFQEFKAACPSGIAFVPEPIDRQRTTKGLKSDYGDFMKWLRTAHPGLPIALPPDCPKIMLRSAEVWLPLVFLASDTSVQVFLGMVGNYLYDRAKGALKGEVPRVHLSLVYEDHRAGKAKRFDFAGDASELQKVIRRFDARNFFTDAP